MSADAGVIAELEERAARYPPDRYPVQHATAQFHLGVALLEAERIEDACDALIAAARLFDPVRLPAEHGKAANVLGAALRTAGRLEEATAAFGRAAQMFDSAGLQLEQGAALFNIGLVERGAGDAAAAAVSFERARELLHGRAAPGQASAAAREHGAVLLELGQTRAAAGALREALRLAEVAGDRAALGAAANALGLAELADDRVDEALHALQTAATANPRSIRPAEYAMAKANLALAQEAAEDVPRARLAARQALSVRQAPEPVVQQSRALLDRLGDERVDLVRVLAGEPLERREATIRDELARWVALDAHERRTEAAAWIEGQLRAEDGAEAAAVLVGGILELPPEAADDVLTALVEAAGEQEEPAAERFRSELGRAMARFHMPQWMRLRDTLSRLAAERGQPAGWG